MIKPANAMTRVVIKNKTRLLIKDDKRPDHNIKRFEIKQIEYEMRALFFHSACRQEHIDLYLYLESKWKVLTQHK